MRESADGRVALGLRAHSGWAVLVALRDPVAAPAVVQRRRLELADRRIAGAVQPYHAAAKMPFAEAEPFLRECAANAAALACRDLSEALAELRNKRYSIAGASILLGSGRIPSNLEATLASHALIHTAEGDFYRDALRRGCEACGISVTGVREKSVWTDAAELLGTRPERLCPQVSEMGKPLGPPWRQDEKLSALAAWITLARQRS